MGNLFDIVNMFLNIPPLLIGTISISSCRRQNYLFSVDGAHKIVCPCFWSWGFLFNFKILRTADEYTKNKLWTIKFQASRNNYRYISKFYLITEKINLFKLMIVTIVTKTIYNSAFSCVYRFMTPWSRTQGITNSGDYKWGCPSNLLHAKEFREM